jgi:ABC-type Fe3+ transport system substrate-binding protein
LAKPQHKGKVAVSGDSTGVRFIGAMLQAKGEEFVKQLRALDMKMHMISGGAMHELMAAGEMPMSISIFRNHVLAAKPKGAPTEWVPMDLNPTNAGGVALPRAIILTERSCWLIFSAGGAEDHGERFRAPRQNYGFKRWYRRRASHRAI